MTVEATDDTDLKSRIPLDELSGAEAGGEGAVDGAVVSFFVRRFAREVDRVFDWFGEGCLCFETANRDVTVRAE